MQSGGDNISSKYNLLGQKFGNLTVIEQTKDKNNKLAWVCECDCENKTHIIVDSHRLIAGIKTHCGCRRTYNLRSNIEFPIVYENKTKICSVCNTEKYFKDFYFREYINKDGNKSFYFDPKCIQCNIDQVQQSRIDNPQYIVDYNHKRYIDKKDDYFKPLLAKHRRENKEKYQEWTSEWRKKNPDKVNDYSNKRRLHKYHNVTRTEWKNCKEYFNNCCAYCGLHISKHTRLYNGEIQNIDLHKEHVNHEGSNELDNCIPSCQSCNSSKREYTLDEWYNENNPNFTQERYDKIIIWLTKDYILYLEEKKPKKKYKKRIKI